MMCREVGALIIDSVLSYNRNMPELLLRRHDSTK